MAGKQNNGSQDVEAPSSLCLCCCIKSYFVQTLRLAIMPISRLFQSECKIVTVHHDFQELCENLQHGGSRCHPAERRSRVWFLRPFCVSCTVCESFASRWPRNELATCSGCHPGRAGYWKWRMVKCPSWCHKTASLPLTISNNYGCPNPILISVRHQPKNKYQIVLDFI